MYEDDALIPITRIEMFASAKLGKSNAPSGEFTPLERYLSYMVGASESYPEKPNTRLECWLDALCKNGILVPVEVTSATNVEFPKGGIAVIRHTFRDTVYETICLIYRPNSTYNFRAVGVFYSGATRLVTFFGSGSSASVKSCPFNASNTQLTEADCSQSYEILSVYKIV